MTEELNLQAEKDWESLSEVWANKFLESIQLPGGVDKDKNIRPSLHAFIMATRLFEKFVKLGVEIGEDALRERVKRLEDALKFYSNEKNYYETYKDSIFRTTYIAEDRGDRARKALEEKP